jgi:hypothetical protein
VKDGKQQSGRSPASSWSGENGDDWSSCNWPKMEERMGGGRSGVAGLIA